MIAGTSMGAIIGGRLCPKPEIAGANAAEAISFGYRKCVIFPIYPTAHRHHKGTQIEDELKTVIGANTEFHDLRIPFSCIGR